MGVKSQRGHSLAGHRAFGWSGMRRRPGMLEIGKIEKLFHFLEISVRLIVDRVEAEPFRDPKWGALPGFRRGSRVDDLAMPEGKLALKH